MRRAKDNIGVDENERGDGLQEHLINVRRVAKVVKGGRLFGFSALTVVGDGKGRVGMGRGKAREVPQAVSKAMDRARKNMFKVSLRGGTLHHAVHERHGGSTIIMRPASDGTGVIAGGTLRAVCEAAGIRNVLTKCLGSTNPINVVCAAMKALRVQRSPERVAEMRGKRVEDIAQE